MKALGLCFILSLVLQSLHIPVAVAAKDPKVKTFVSRSMTIRRELMAKMKGPIWGIAFLPEGQALLTQKQGEIQHFDPSTGALKQVSGGPPAVVHGQGGLHDLVLSPEFAKDAKVFLSYAKKTGDRAYTTAVGVATWKDGKLEGFREIFAAAPSVSSGQHFGGRLVADAAGSLYVSIGDRGDRDLAQDLGAHAGKVLRLTWEGAPHPDNPFLKRKGARPEIFTYGHRNPQGMARHPVTGRIWVQEHGPRGGDEINLLEAGKNYGWPLATFGREYWGPKIGETTAKGTEPPIHHWTPSIAPSGFVIYESLALPEWRGLFFSGALAQTHLNIVEIKDGRSVKEERLFKEDKQRVRDVRQAPDGTLWYSTDEGHLYRLSLERPAR